MPGAVPDTYLGSLTRPLNQNPHKPSLGRPWHKSSILQVLAQSGALDCGGPENLSHFGSKCGL